MPKHKEKQQKESQKLNKKITQQQRKMEGQHTLFRYKAQVKEVEQFPLNETETSTGAETTPATIAGQALYNLSQGRDPVTNFLIFMVSATAAGTEVGEATEAGNNLGRLG